VGDRVVHHREQTYKLVGVFWALGIVLHYYLLAPLLALPIMLRSRIQPWLMLVIYAGMVYWCEYAAMHLNWSWDGRNIVSNLPHFFAGMIACRMVASVERPRTWVVALCLVCTAGLLGYTNWIYHMSAGQFWSVRGVLLTDALIVLLVIAHGHLEKWPRPAGVIVAGFSLLGTLSYGVYAWHGYIIKYISWTAEHMVVLILLSVALSYVSYFVIERPALAHKKHSANAAGIAKAVKPVSAW
jgi:peptidoglycan/LPS O-acetylase OafA/YrhL